MKTNYQNTIPRIIGVGVFMLAAMDLNACAFRFQTPITMLTSSLTMRSSTAVMFMWTALLLAAMFDMIPNSPWRQTLAVSLGMALVVTVSLITCLSLAIASGDISPTMAVFTPNPVTLIGFMLIGLSSISHVIGSRFSMFVVRMLGLGIIVVGLLALLGYAAGIPSLYFSTHTAMPDMAISTALAFIGCGWIMNQAETNDPCSTTDPAALMEQP